MSNTSKPAGKRQMLTATLKSTPAKAFFSGGRNTASGTGQAKATRSLLERAKAAHDAITDEEDAAITAAARTDPDNPPLSKRGRPRLESPKVSILLRLDPDVVERFKADGSGWQTRMNDALRKAAGLK